jgi:hypothetical protein
MNLDDPLGHDWGIVKEKTAQRRKRFHALVSEKVKRAASD